jgi:predicted ArsR family transcriptional regulator
VSRRDRAAGVDLRKTQNGAALQRERILAYLQEEGPVGLPGLALELHMGHTTLLQRLRELGAEVVIKGQRRGCRMVGLRSDATVSP